MTENEPPGYLVVLCWGEEGFDIAPTKELTNNTIFVYSCVFETDIIHLHIAKKKPKFCGLE